MDDNQPFLCTTTVQDTPRFASAAATPPSEDDFGLIGQSPPMRALRDTLRTYAASRANVLIEGESGTGKELAARAVANGPFVAVNGATLRGSMLADELFGHVRGAFTGAIGARRGLLELADGGTLFIDEVGELDAVVQAELLRVIETGEVRPVGSERVRHVRVRIVAATHRDLVAMVRAGTFREDLFFRLYVLNVMMPPLRDCTDDLPLLCEHLLARLRPEIGERDASPDALLRLAEHRWPGNVRELSHVLHRAALTTRARTLTADDVSPMLERTAGTRPAPQTIVNPAAAIRTALQLSKGSVSGAAKLLGIPRSTLRDRLARVGERVS